MKRVVCLLVVVFAAGACSKPSVDPTPVPASVAVPIPPPMASTAPGASTASATPGTARSWRGTYKSTALAMSVPPDWKKVHWADPQNTDGLGDGPMALTVDPTGHVSGTVDGPLGPATVDGMATDGQLSATVRRKDANDKGFTGTLLGAVTADHVEGTMNLSLGLASAVRSATFTLARAPAP